MRLFGVRVCGLERAQALEACPPLLPLRACPRHVRELRVWGVWSREAPRRPGAQAASRMQAQAPARGAPPVRVTRGLTPRVVAFSIFSRDVWSQRFIIPRKHSTQYVLSSQCSDTESHFDSTTMGPSHDCDIVFSTDFRKVSSDCTRLGAASSKAPTLPLLSRARVGEGGGTGQAWHMGHMVHDRAWEARGWVG